MDSLGTVELIRGEATLGDDPVAQVGRGAPGQTIVLPEGALARLGGEAYLASVGRKQPEVFCSLLAKLLPKGIGFRMRRSSVV